VAQQTDDNRTTRKKIKKAPFLTAQYNLYKFSAQLSFVSASLCGNTFVLTRMGVGVAKDGILKHYKLNCVHLDCAFLYALNLPMVLNFISMKSEVLGTSVTINALLIQRYGLPLNYCFSHLILRLAKVES
jgi:hypothetical protein